MSIHVIAPGALTTVQDIGRSKHQKYGFQENGVCDKYSYHIANMIVGNGLDSNVPVLEMTYMGGTFRFDSHELICLTGADMKAELNGIPIQEYEPIHVAPGDVLKMDTAVTGLRSYLSVYGGIDVPAVMDSASTSLKCSIGGYEGRALKEGDVLRCIASDDEVKDYLNRRVHIRRGVCEYPMLKSPGVRIVDGKVYQLIRVVMGPQEEAFTPKGLKTFEQGIFRISDQSDRMAYRLEGDIIETLHGSDIISDGIVEGSVQVSSDGQPIIMMADHQTTGGYAKIAIVISADIPRLAQMKPGERIGFLPVSVREAVMATREMNHILRKMEAMNWWT